MKVTLQGLEERIAWLEDELRTAHKLLAQKQAAEKKPKKAVSLELPGIPAAPPREKSQAELDYESFQEMRESSFKRNGIDFVADDPPGWAHVQMALKKIRAAAGNNDRTLFSLFADYFAEVYPAKMTPPYPFTAFTSEKIWPKLLEAYRAEGSAEGGA